MTITGIVLMYHALKRGEKTTRKIAYEISDLTCPECGNRFLIPRRSNKLRKDGHIKDIWCPFCSKETKMVEGNRDGRKRVR